MGLTALNQMVRGKADGLTMMMLNGAAALYTARFTPLETWALYNGLIAYLLIGAVFAVELAIRSVVKRRFTS